MDNGTENELSAIHEIRQIVKFCKILVAIGL